MALKILGLSLLTLFLIWYELVPLARRREYRALGLALALIIVGAVAFGTYLLKPEFLSLARLIIMLLRPLTLLFFGLADPLSRRNIRKPRNPVLVLHEDIL